MHEAFLNAHNKRLSRFGVVTILKRHVAAAATQQLSLATKRISPHTMRHYVPFLTMSRTSPGIRFFR